MRNKRIVALCLIFSLMSGVLPRTILNCQAAVSGTVSPRWISVQSAEAELIFSGKNAVCTINVMGDNNSSITGIMKLTLIKTDGTMKEIKSWNVYGSKNLIVTKTATISESGIYQLSFSGTATMTNGSTENVTASETRMY